MQQHRQFSCRGHDGSLLAVPSATLRQLQAPAPSRKARYRIRCICICLCDCPKVGDVSNGTRALNQLFEHHRLKARQLDVPSPAASRTTGSTVASFKARQLGLSGTYILSSSLEPSPYKADPKPAVLPKSNPMSSVVDRGESPRFAAVNRSNEFSPTESERSSAVARSNGNGRALAHESDSGNAPGFSQMGHPGEQGGSAADRG